MYLVGGGREMEGRPPIVIPGRKIHAVHAQHPDVVQIPAGGRYSFIEGVRDL